MIEKSHLCCGGRGRARGWGGWGGGQLEQEYRNRCIFTTTCPKWICMSTSYHSSSSECQPPGGGRGSRVGPSLCDVRCLPYLRCESQQYMTYDWCGSPAGRRLMIGRFASHGPHTVSVHDAPRHLRAQSYCMSVIEISPLFSWPTWATACIIACLIDTFLWHIACPTWTLLGFVHVCVAHPCVLRLHILVESYNICTPVVHWFSPLHCDLEVPRSNPTHVCDGFFFWFVWICMKNCQIMV